MSFTPWASSGWIFTAAHFGLLVHTHHPRDVRPVNVGVHEPHALTPANRARATARLVETVDFPTPPFPDEMAMTVPR